MAASLRARGYLLTPLSSSNSAPAASEFYRSRPPAQADLC